MKKGKCGKENSTRKLNVTAKACAKIEAVIVKISERPPSLIYNGGKVSSKARSQPTNLSTCKDCRTFNTPTKQLYIKAAANVI